MSIQKPAQDIHGAGLHIGAAVRDYYIVNNLEEERKVFKLTFQDTENTLSPKRDAFKIIFFVLWFFITIVYILLQQAALFYKDLFEQVSLVTLSLGDVLSIMFSVRKPQGFVIFTISTWTAVQKNDNNNCNKQFFHWSPQKIFVRCVIWDFFNTEIKWKTIKIMFSCYAKRRPSF